ncbi:efflux RND transporter periplasmic adaptor subunit [Glutamicibacter mishrai]|uniref:Efflux RND transporter periplasmic adaptor subunit n=1 Tax=Glutamicibacter mishrai TaxID=1775880 RepID=A0A6H0SP91_9MICC|nr:efflux RND transporter periplasmic adaptor subunit [Glutamicibacter mishrai]QIV88249.1 efflux RND transporter periplasmic adaptor subunit [Glutamicibacter mishrai]UTT41016.1 efflux RND transporter periplasmic adaptor subunit [Glutamicibacter mishrai]
MSHRRVFRRFILPSAWLIIGALIAVSLVKLAFVGGSPAADDQLYPSGEIPAETVLAEKDTIKNSLSIPGTIELVESQPLSAPSAGVLNWAFVKAGDNVSQGDKIFQLRVESTVEPAPTNQSGPGEHEADEAEAQPADDAPATTVSYHDVLAPAAGKVGKFDFSIGDEIEKGATLASVQPQSFHAVGIIKALDRYRIMDENLDATISIEGGPEPFTCVNLNVGDQASETPANAASEEEAAMDDSAAQPQDESSSGSEVSCDVPKDVVVFDGLDMTMDIDAGSAEDVLTVPVTAVRGLVGKGAVWILNDEGKEIRTEVELGVTDGKVVEIRSGLTSDAEVLRYVPGSAPAPSMEPGMEIYP